MTWRNISEDMSLKQDCSEDFKPPKRTIMLNKYEASDDLIRKYVELKILLKTISFLLGHRFNTANTKVIKFDFDFYPEPVLSKQFMCANPT
jgi:hypothetical protein